MIDMSGNDPKTGCVCWHAVGCAGKRPDRISDRPIGSPDQADESQELTYVDIDTFLASFSSSPTRVGLGTVRTSYGIDPYLALW